MMGKGWRVGCEGGVGQVGRSWRVLEVILGS